MDKTHLDLHDIQGNIVKAYGRYGFPKGRYVLFSVCEGAAGRRFVQALAPTITTSAPWRVGDAGSAAAPVPEVTTNIAFSYHGLRELGVPRASLQSFPDDGRDGHEGARDISATTKTRRAWDRLDRGDRGRHGLDHGQTKRSEQRYPRGRLAEQSSALDGTAGVAAAWNRGPRRSDLPYHPRDYVEGQPSSKEHFGYTCIGDRLKGRSTSPT